MSLFLGIDFGTSTNVVTRWDEDKKKAVPIPLGSFNAANSNVFSNVIYYESSNNVIVGDYAASQGKIYPENAVFAVKRCLENSDFKRYISVLGRNLSSEDIASDIFAWIKKEVENKFGGQKINGVVISVPFAFQNHERKRIERAAQRAGLNVLGLIEEPVAAALSFGLVEQAERGKTEKILVFDLGGGTFDVTIFDFQKQSDRQFAIKVITTDGEKKLGGIDIDDMIVDKMHSKLEEKFPEYQLDSREAKIQEKEILKMHQIAIEAKENLSTTEEYDLFFDSNVNDSFFLDETITEEEFKEWLHPFLNKIENALDSALNSADLTRNDIDRIIMVGGTSIIPVINDIVREYFHKEPECVRQLNLMVGEGAGIYCGLKYVEKSLECKISVGVSQNIGIKWKHRFELMLERNTLYGTPSKLLKLNIPNPGQKDEVISIVQGSRIRNTKVASINIPITLQKKLSEDKLGLRLNTDVNNGTIIYELYDLTTDGSKIKVGTMLKSDKAGEE